MLLFYYKEFKGCKEGRGQGKVGYRAALKLRLIISLWIGYKWGVKKYRGN